MTTGPVRMTLGSMYRIAVGAGGGKATARRRCLAWLESLPGGQRAVLEALLLDQTYLGRKAAQDYCEENGGARAYPKWLYLIEESW